jgi:iron-sulfur cluster repair protein YtfE (RIC family)
VEIGRLHNLTTTPILELMLAYPQVKEILDGFGPDTCCGSHMSIEEAAADSGVASAPVFEALRNVLH